MAHSLTLLCADDKTKKNLIGLEQPERAEALVVSHIEIIFPNKHGKSLRCLRQRWPDNTCNGKAEPTVVFSQTS